MIIARMHFDILQRAKFPTGGWNRDGWPLRPLLAALHEFRRVDVLLTLTHLEYRVGWTRSQESFVF
jgi:hypothetical protein